MKKCHKSKPEPDCLSQFRAANPAGTWNEFKDVACYDFVRERLRLDQRGLCAYCEIVPLTNNEQVAHFHPKSDTAGPQNWALDWDNMWMACKGGTKASSAQNEEEYLPPLPENRSCDENTDDRILDGQVLSPADMPAFPRIFRFEQHPDEIRIAPDAAGCAEAGIPEAIAQRSIDEYNLNCGRLARSRLAVSRPLENLKRRIRDHGNISRVELTNLVRIQLGPLHDGQWAKFFTLVRWHFGGIEYPRLIGHGGVPVWTPQGNQPDEVTYEFGRDQREYLLSYGEKFQRFGFAELTFDRERLEVRYITELGNESKKELLTAHA